MSDPVVSFLIRFLQIFSELLVWALFVYVIMSWVSPRKTPFRAYLERIVLPILQPFRWARIGMMDFSVIVAFLVIQYGTGILIGLLLGMKGGV